MPIGSIDPPTHPDSISALLRSAPSTGGAAWRVMSRLDAHPLAGRFVLRGGGDGAPALGYRLTTPPGVARLFRPRLGSLAAIRHPHILPIEQVITSDERGCWLVAPYVGGHHGITSLADALTMRMGGRLPAPEVVRLGRQLLGASAAAHRRGVVHGPVGLKDVLISRRGLVMVELYGLGALLAGADDDRAALASLEVQSVGRLLHRCATGVEFGVREQSHAPGLHRRWRRWIRAVGGGAYAAASDALDAAPAAWGGA